MPGEGASKAAQNLSVSPGLEPELYQELLVPGPDASRGSTLLLTALPAAGLLQQREAEPGRSSGPTAAGQMKQARLLRCLGLRACDDPFTAWVGPRLPLLQLQ